MDTLVVKDQTPEITLTNYDPLDPGWALLVGPDGAIDRFTFAGYGGHAVNGGAVGSAVFSADGGVFENFGQVGTISVSFSFQDDSAQSVVIGAATIRNHGQIEDTSPGNTAVVMMRNRHPVLENDGTIAGEGSMATVYIDSETAVIENTGTITATSPFGVTLLIEVEDHAQVFNAGDIRGSDAAPTMVLLARVSATVVNKGTIEGGVHLGPVAGLEDQFAGAMVGNSGSMTSPTAWAVDLHGGNVVLGNSGVILGMSSLEGGAVLQMDGAGNRLINTGHIGHQPGGDGRAVEMTGGGAVFRNAGTVQGDVAFGDGADRYAGTGGAVDGAIDMGLGADRATGGGARDVMLGGGGRDALMGAGGADVLVGQAGADMLDGGRGDDLLIGGAGPDVFVFGAASGVDVIADFSAGDRLDLSALGAPGEAEVLSAASEDAEGVRIDLTALGGDGSVLLAGVGLGDLQGDWVA